MSSSDLPPLTVEQVARIAAFARLRLGDADIERYRTQLTSILDHVARLDELDLSGVEPLTHPGGANNRFEADEPQAPLPLDALARNAPAMEECYLAVPKVLTHGGEGS
jgi:aspartyl-tRNA(Asn)/glutamyl-tRNA(Gln) amidotransferase subunit C